MQTILVIVVRLSKKYKSPIVKPYQDLQNSVVGFPIQTTLMVSEDGHILEFSHVEKNILTNALPNLKKLPTNEIDWPQINRIYACEYQGQCILYIQDLNFRLCIMSVSLTYYRLLLKCASIFDFHFIHDQRVLKIYNVINIITLLWSRETKSKYLMNLGAVYFLSTDDRINVVKYDYHGKFHRQISRSKIINRKRILS